MPIDHLKLLKNGLRLSLVAFVSVVLVACSESSDEKTVEKSESEKTEVNEKQVNVPSPARSFDMADVMEKGPLEEKAFGDPNAPVKIVEYMSMTCPHCGSFHIDTYPKLKEKFIDTGKVYFLLREFPFDPRAAGAIMLARCAPEDNFEAMIDVLFQQQSNWARAQNGREALLQIARLAGFTQESFEQCLTNTQLLSDINAVKDRASKEFKIQSTPSFIINGDLYEGALSIEQISAIVESRL